MRSCHATYKNHWILLSLRMLLSVVLITGSITGCKEDQDPSEPFVRLLENQTIHSNIFNQDINYAVLLPDAYASTTDSFPVVYLLHGYGDEYTAWYKGGMIQYYSDQVSALTGPMIFVMPQGFNTYFVNRQSGNLPYMDFFVTELVPGIDAVYRTKKDKSQRAVMGYSMGGYGALILPVKNPGVFSISVPLSMSFRTDDQYMAEPQDSWDSQWGIIFGGLGMSGEARLTDYFKAHSPFHFFDQEDLSEYMELRFFIDCGDDEETLSVTNGALHNLMSYRSVPHEFRVRNGDHSWDYWHGSLPEALTFISYGFRGQKYPADPEPIDPGILIPNDQYHLEPLEGQTMEVGIFKPPAYDQDTKDYPVIFFIHDDEGLSRKDQAIELISLLYNKMISSKIPNALVVEIPYGPEGISEETMVGIIDHVGEHYRMVGNKKGRVLMGNEKGAAAACALMHEFSDTFNGCFLYNAELDMGVSSVPGVFYYIDLVDKSTYCQENYDIYLDLRQKDGKHEYRVRQGAQDFQSILNGMDASIGYLSQELTGQSD